MSTSDQNREVHGLSQDLKETKPTIINYKLIGAHASSRCGSEKSRFQMTSMTHSIVVSKESLLKVLTIGAGEQERKAK
jgi:hypothetical protein